MFNRQKIMSRFVWVSCSPSPPACESRCKELGVALLNYRLAAHRERPWRSHGRERFVKFGRNQDESALFSADFPERESAELQKGLWFSGARPAGCGRQQLKNSHHQRAGDSESRGTQVGEEGGRETGGL